jgi:hypothetical protein
MFESCLGHHFLGSLGACRTSSNVFRTVCSNIGVSTTFFARYLARAIVLSQDVFRHKLLPWNDALESTGVRDVSTDVVWLKAGVATRV